MRILHVITSLQTGGAETLVVNLVARLRGLGHEADVAVLNGRQTPLMERLERECPECRIYRLGSSYYNPWHIVRLARVMRRYDVVHAHNSSPQFFVAVAGVLCSVVLVTTEHNTSNRRRDWKWYPVALDRWMYRQFRRVICISQQAEANLRAFIGTDAKNIVTIYNGVDVGAFHDAQPAAGLRGAEGRFAVVMVAGFRYQKDQDTLLRAMALLPEGEYELWLVGDGERRRTLEQMIDDLHLKSRVRLLGLRQDVAAILHAADVVVMSSHFEGLSLSNIEGMAVGRPFIASDVDGLREMTRGYGLLFPHGDAEALARLIMQLHDDRAFYREVAARCYERAREFDISVMVNRYNEVYSSLRR